MKSVPNILLLMSDQHRGDCLGSRGHPVVRTPNLDQLAADSADFRRAYSATALCAPARRTLLSGQRASRHGVLDQDAKKPLNGPTLPKLLADAGFQTHLVGKLHLWPKRNYYGFGTADWADWVDPNNDNDYSSFMRDRVGTQSWINDHHNFDQNSRQICTWALDEELHVASWSSRSALRFLASRDQTRPFFLMVSFIPPHPPLFPMAHLLKKYLAVDTPTPIVGSWATPLAEPAADGVFNAWHGRLEATALHSFRAAYYATIEHVDAHVGAILQAIPEDTLVLYLSDHGDMLGDHYLYQKRAPYEQATNIPMMIRLPNGHEGCRPTRVNVAVELMDVVPTILDYVGLPIPRTVDGVSLLPLIRGDHIQRQYIHGENAYLRSLDSGFQFVSDGKWKFIWYPDIDWEQLFNLESDPGETQDLAGEAAYGDTLSSLKDQLIKALVGRSENFTDGVRLLSQDERESSLRFAPP